MELDYHVMHYDNAFEEDPIIYKRVEENLEHPVTAINIDGEYVSGGMRTGQELHTKGIKEIDKLLSWIHEGVLLSAAVFAGSNSNVPKIEDYHNSTGEIVKQFKEDAFRIDQCWAVQYGKGGGVVPHNHFPYALSFVYYVRTPDGCSPLMLDDQTLKVNEGEVLFWNGNVQHSVPPSNVEGRCVVVGNILYTP